MERRSRRRFLEDSLALLTVSALPLEGARASTPRPVKRKAWASERIRVAVVGFRSRGMSHVEAYTGMPDVEIVALCDADTAVFPRALKAIETAGRPAPQTHQDIRRVLDDKSIDAVSIATPNHWHALASVWAMQAGKDVYVEKPISHNVTEGRRIVQAARRYNRICQAGMQSRSNKGMQEAMAYLHGGQLGKVRLARGLCYKTRRSIGKVDGDQAPPATVDYDLWLGPAPVTPVHRRQFHYDWHWLWDYGNGDLGNQGVHEMDKARWGLGQRGMPLSVIQLGGRFGYVDDGQTPNTSVTVFDYGDSELIFEVRGLVEPEPPGRSERDWLKIAPNEYKVGNIFYGEKGVMVSPNYASAVVFDNDGNPVTSFKGDGDHFRNFIDTMRTGRHTDLAADCEEGHLSAALCHLGNISYLRGVNVPFNPRTGAFGDDREAMETFGRFEEHLASNGLTLNSETYRLGKRLRVDPRRECLVGDRAANQLLTREYRKGFEVPGRP